MNDPHPIGSSPEETRTVFQKATGEVLAQRIEALAYEIRAVGNAQPFTLASTETLSSLAMTLRTILKKIDDIFDFEGLVFTPACTMLLDLFQARARGSVISASSLCRTLNCPQNVGTRWIDVLESKNLLEKFHDKSEETKVSLTEKGYLKTAQALQLLL